MATLQSQIDILAANEFKLYEKLENLEYNTLGITYDQTKTIINSEGNNSQTVIDYLGYNVYDAMVVMKNEEGTSDFFKREYNLMGYDGECFKLKDDDKKILDLALNQHTLKLLELQYVTIENDIAKWEFKYKFDKASKVILLDETDYNIEETIYTNSTCTEKAKANSLSNNKLSGQDYYKGDSSYYTYVDINLDNTDTLDSIYIIAFKEDANNGTYFKNDNGNYTISNGGSATNSYSIENIEHISYINLDTGNYYINLDTSSIIDFTETLIITTPLTNNGNKLTKCQSVNNSLILYYDKSSIENSIIISDDNKKNILRLNRYYGVDLSGYDNGEGSIQNPYKYYNLFHFDVDNNISYPEIHKNADDNHERIYETIVDLTNPNRFPRLDRIHLYSDGSSLSKDVNYKNINIINNMKSEILKNNKDTN